MAERKPCENCGTVIMMLPVGIFESLEPYEVEGDGCLHDTVRCLRVQLAQAQDTIVQLKKAVR
jgi:hypothetical protein